MDVRSNYLSRFSYLAAFLLALTCLIMNKKKLVSHPLVIAFILVLIFGSFKGLLEGNFNSKFLSHIYFVFMPVTMLSYGWHFFERYEQSYLLQKKFSNVMYISFYAGLSAVILFQIAYQSGFAKYDAIGMWNFVLSGPFLLNQQYGITYFGISLLGSVLSAKRGFIVISLLFLILLLFFKKRKSKWRTISMLLICGVTAGILFEDQFGGVWGRVDRTVVALQQGDFDMAFAMRWTESISALEHLISRLDHLLIGAGFGAQFLPWPNVPGYEDYYSHYTHFSVVSYAWLGGVLFSICLYFSLIALLISLARIIRLGLIESKYNHFFYWLCGILVGSISGAELMTNPYLWFIIGLCLQLNRCYSSRRVFQSAFSLSSRPIIEPDSGR